MTTHPFRGGGPFLLLIRDTSQHLGTHYVFSICITQETFCLSLSPSCFAFCDHHLSPRIAIVFSLLCSVPNFSMSHLVYFPHLQHMPFLLVYFTFSNHMSSTLYCFATRAHLCLYSFVACLSHFAIDHASLSRRSIVPTPNGDTS